MSFKVKQLKRKEKDYELRSYKVYSFEKAPKEVQEKALEKYRYFNVENRNMLEDDDFLIDLSIKREVREKVGVGNTLFSWKGGNYNVDYGYNYVQFKDLKVNDDEAFRQELGVSKKVWDKVDYHFVNPSGERNTYIEFTDKETGYEVDLPSAEQEELNKASDHFSYLMKETNKVLKQDYEYNISDEAVKESLIANDYKFNEKGEID